MPATLRRPAAHHLARQRPGDRDDCLATFVTITKIGHDPSSRHATAALCRLNPQPRNPTGAVTKPAPRRRNLPALNALRDPGKRRVDRPVRPPLS